MTKAKRLEYRRKFLLRFCQFILNDGQYDDVSFNLPQANWDSDSIGSTITITVVREPYSYWSKVSWDLLEISHPANANDQSQNSLIRCKLDQALWDIEELENKNAAKKTTDTPEADATESNS